MLILLTLIAAIAVAAVALWPSSSNESASPTTAAPQATTAAPTTTRPPMLGNALALADLDGWLQTSVNSLEDLRGQVVIVQFWTFGCYNCKNTIPHLQGHLRQIPGPGLGNRRGACA